MPFLRHLDDDSLRAPGLAEEGGDGRRFPHYPLWDLSFPGFHDDVSTRYVLGMEPQVLGGREPESDLPVSLGARAYKDREPADFEPAYSRGFVTRLFP